MQSVYDSMNTVLSSNACSFLQDLVDIEIPKQPSIQSVSLPGVASGHDSEAITENAKRHPLFTDLEIHARNAQRLLHPCAGKPLNSQNFGIFTSWPSTAISREEEAISRCKRLSLRLNSANSRALAN